MRKLTGALCVLLGGVLALWTALGEWNRRRTALEDLRRGLCRLGEEVRLSRTPLPVLLRYLAQDCGADAAAFFRDVSARLQQGEGLEESWKTAADALPLSVPDWQTVAELGGELRGDEERIRRGLLAAAERLNRSGVEMDGRRSAEVRRLAALYLSGAALAVILLY